MGTIISGNKSVDKLRFVMLKKGQVTNASRVLNLGEGDYLLELENGSYTIIGHRRHSPNGNWAVVGYGLDRWTKSVLNGLVEIGVITRAAVNEHVATEESRKAKRDWVYNIRQFRKQCEKLGLDFPARSLLPDWEGGPSFKTSTLPWGDRYEIEHAANRVFCVVYPGDKEPETFTTMTKAVNAVEEHFEGTLPK